MFLRGNYIVFLKVKKNMNQLLNKEKVALFPFWKVNIVIMKVNTA